MRYSQFNGTQVQIILPDYPNLGCISFRIGMDPLLIPIEGVSETLRYIIDFYMATNHGDCKDFMLVSSTVACSRQIPEADFY